jgi:phospholipid/cholesterol/gamma-HCH transport system substrate-binding protein
MLSKVAKLAVFAAITLGCTAFIALKIIGLHSGLGHHWTATFGDVTGLYSGDPVELAGVQVGKVSHVKLVNGQADVGISVKSNVKLPVDSQVAVRWRNLIGQRFVALYPGRSAQLLANGHAITKTTSVVDLGEFVNKLGPLIGEISPQQLNEIFTAVSQALNGNQANVGSLVADLTGLVSTLAQRNQTIAQLVTDYKTITGTLATRDQQVQTMIDNLVILSQAFSDNSQLVGNALHQVSGLSSGLDRLLAGSGSQLAGVVDHLSVLTGVLHARVGDLEAALHGLPTAIQVLFNATNKGPYLEADLGCVSLQPTCGYPFVLSPAQAGQGTAQPASFPHNSATAFRRLLVGAS